MNDSDLAVTVTNAYKGYGSGYILKGLNMSVSKGSIYALLGPSGCGKTTLLSCIVRRLELDSGSITTTARKRNAVGFMPQSVALYMTLTITETLAYYGRVYGMEPKEIEEQTKKLEVLLELPPRHRIVETLSGGQQRRVSLAVSLINNPEILILDEPTVGLDPVLSDSIWRYLIEIVRDEKKTVIITTHYIQEARQANKVGLMRGGVLLCEETPGDLLEKTGADTLEEAFYKLSYKQETLSCKGPLVTQRLPKATRRADMERKSRFSVACFFAELFKNYLFLWRNKPMLAFLLGLPIVTTVLFNLAVGHSPSGLKIGVVNSETPHGIVDCLMEAPNVKCNFSYPFSCRFIRKLHQNGLIVSGYNDIDEALEAAKRNDVWGVIEVPDNYTYSVLNRLEFNIKTKDFHVDHGSVNVWLDMSNQNIGTQLKVNLWATYANYMEELFDECGWPPKALSPPIQRKRPVYGEKVANLNHYASPAIVILIIFYFPMTYTIGVLVQEKLLGVLERSLTAGVHLTEVFLAHTAIQLTVLIVQMTSTMIVLYYIFESPFIGDPLSPAFLLLFQGINGIAFGFLVALTFDKMLQATYASLGATFTYFFLSGLIWPQQGAHDILKAFHWATPVSYSVEALRALTVKAWPSSHPIVIRGYASVIGWTLAFCLAAHVVLRMRKGTFVAA